MQNGFVLFVNETNSKVPKMCFFVHTMQLIHRSDFHQDFVGHKDWWLAEPRIKGRMADRWAPVMTFVQLARLILMCIVWDSLSTTSRAYFESTSFHDLRPLELYNEAVSTTSPL